MEFDGEESEGEEEPVQRHPSHHSVFRPTDALSPTSAAARGLEVEGEDIESSEDESPSPEVLGGVVLHPPASADDASAADAATADSAGVDAAAHSRRSVSSTPCDEANVSQTSAAAAAAAPVQAAGGGKALQVQAADTTSETSESQAGDASSGVLGKLEGVSAWLEKKKSSTSTLLKEHVVKRYADSVVQITDNYADGTPLPEHLKRLRRANINVHACNRERNKALTDHCARIGETLEGRSKALCSMTDTTLNSLHKTTRNLAGINLAMAEATLCFPFLSNKPA